MLIFWHIFSSTCKNNMMKYQLKKQKNKKTMTKIQLQKDFDPMSKAKAMSILLLRL